MKNLLLTLSIATLVSGCFGGGDDELTAETRPWALDPQAAYEAEAEAETQLETAEAGAADDDLDGGRSDSRFRNGCEMIIRTVWAETNAGRYIIEAESKSAECEGAELSLAIRAPNRRVVYRANLKADEVYGFTEVRAPLEMRGALIDWATNYGSLTRRSGRLPYWPRGAIQPTVAGAYPFIVDEVWERVTYLEVREANLPVYCHVLDLESMNCLVLHDAEQDVVPLGVQKFPPRGGSSGAAATTDAATQ